MIRLRFASVDYLDWGCISRFEDGSTVSAIPHPWDHCYSIIAMRCGYGFDLMAYCREHEVAHHLVCEALLGGPSPVLWGLAHEKPLPASEAAFEEMMAQGLQRFARAAERPIIGGVDWDALAARFVQALP